MNWTIFIAIAVILVMFLLVNRASFVSADKARQFVREGALVVDVRNPGEFTSGHIPGAVNVPLGELTAEAPKQFPDKNRVILLHCLSGARSGIAKRQLKSQGYANVFNLGSYSRAEGIVRGAPQ